MIGLSDDRVCRHGGVPGTCCPLDLQLWYWPALPACCLEIRSLERLPLLCIRVCNDGRVYPKPGCRDERIISRGDREAAIELMAVRKRCVRGTSCFLVKFCRNTTRKPLEYNSFTDTSPLRLAGCLLLSLLQLHHLCSTTHVASETSGSDVEVSKSRVAAYLLHDLLLLD